MLGEGIIMFTGNISCVQAPPVNNPNYFNFFSPPQALLSYCTHWD
jgi:hypothetical protein